ncbi:plasmid replication/partition related protein [Roseateles sp. BYS180W]|uniref:Plasmid replication/partition related protein n=1 Tax=Roseateles rivi TaxID=3299028 RepID=A0ABW7FSE4_9BURK
MNIVVLEELRAYIDPLTPDEHAALERSILAEGCRDALVLWGDVLVDGHNRYGICTKHGLPFETVQNPRFKSMEDVHLWMIDQHLGRRSVSDFQRGVLALRKKEILETRRRGALAPDDTAAATEAESEAAPAPWEGEDGSGASASASPELPPAPALKSREAVARAARISAATVSQIEKIQKAAAPELVAAVKAGEISISAAAILTELPTEQQAQAAAGGKKALRDTAKQLRATRQPRKAADNAEPANSQTDSQTDTHSGSAEPLTDAQRAGFEAQVSALQQEVQRLNAVLAERDTALTQLRQNLARAQTRLAQLGQPLEAPDEGAPAA